MVLITLAPHPFFADGLFTRRGPVYATSEGFNLVAHVHGEREATLFVKMRCALLFPILLAQEPDGTEGGDAHALAIHTAGDMVFLFFHAHQLFNFSPF